MKWFRRKNKSKDTTNVYDQKDIKSMDTVQTNEDNQLREEEEDKLIAASLVEIIDTTTMFLTLFDQMKKEDLSFMSRDFAKNLYVYLDSVASKCKLLAEEEGPKLKQTIKELNDAHKYMESHLED